MSTPNGDRPGAVDLTTCDREPIHILDNVQPHGALLALDPADLSVLQASESTLGCFGVPAEEVIARGLGALFDGAQIGALRVALGAEGIQQNPLHLLTAVIGGAGAFDVIGHAHDGVVILELEPSQPVSAGVGDFYALLRRAVRDLDGASTLEAFCALVVDAVRTISGFDRVMIYRFLDDGSGAVIAEARAPEAEPFLGLRYPASDIPRQARDLYRRNAVRIIADARYAPARLVPALCPLTGRPLDLTYAALRGVSVMHTEYLANMGVRASMSLAITRGDALWGLVACHHGAPRRLPYAARSACEIVARLMSLQIADKVTVEDAAYRERMYGVQDRLITRLAGNPRLLALLEGDPSLLSFLDCAGVAVVSEGECGRAGAAPTEPQIRALVAWLGDAQPGSVLATDALPQGFPPAASFEGAATGLLSLRLSSLAPEYILWFRPEVARTVDWAGDPSKPVTVGPTGSRLTPRGSFALWTETVRGRAAPWREVEGDAARRLGLAFTDLVLRRNAELAAVNAELSRSNAELEAFAYASSHDLKEPIRGIHNYAAFLLEDYQDKLDAEGKGKLASMLRLTERMRSLIDSLLHFSRVGKAPLAIGTIDLGALVPEALEGLTSLIAETGARVVVPRPLPVVEADPAPLRELFSNLVSNAIKYNDKPKRLVEIGYDDGGARGSRRFYVKDNGIGIPARHREAIFRIFKRLHPPGRFGGGAGVGLTIAQRIVQHHGGRLWVESTEGVGTTFWFTLESVG